MNPKLCENCNKKNATIYEDWAGCWCQDCWDNRLIRDTKTNHIVCLSGGKDSTALALRLQEVEPRDYIYLCTPTGDELPELFDHWKRLEALLGKPITYLQHPSGLDGLIKTMNGLPNFRMRWCTRILKIQMCQVFLKDHSPAVLYVGLRADEESRKGAIYGDIIEHRYPLREWDWKLLDVQNYLAKRGVEIPARTDCARCFFQRIGEWRALWRNYPDTYASAEMQEQETGKTFRTPGRDTWPVALKDLRKDFERGRKVRGEKDPDQLEMFVKCRVCEL